MKRVRLGLIVGFVCVLAALATAGIYFNVKCNPNTIKSRQNISITGFDLANRTVVKKGNEFIIGNNVKELDNDFYDVKIRNLDDGIIIYLNKLWHDSYGEDYIEDEYLAQICRELGSKLNICEDEEELEYKLYKYIKDNYIRARQGDNIARTTTNKLILEMELEDSIVKLIIRSK